MIEITTINGFKRMLNVLEISAIGELANRSGTRSNTVIEMRNGDTVFISESYSEVKDLYEKAVKF